MTRTEGKWKVTTASDTGHKAVQVEHGPFICELDPLPEAEDNALVIASAPNLLEGCEVALDCFLHICRTCESTLPRPCKCKWQVIITDLTKRIAEAKSGCESEQKTDESLPGGGTCSVSEDGDKHLALKKAAQKAAETGSRADLQEYMRVRRNAVCS